MSSSIKCHGPYTGRAFLFVGRAAKSINELPNFDPRVLEVEPGSRPLKNELECSDSKLKKIVEEVADGMQFNEIKE